MLYMCIIHSQLWQNLNAKKTAGSVVNTPGAVASRGKFKQNSYMYCTGLVWENHIIAGNWWPLRITKTLIFLITQ